MSAGYWLFLVSASTGTALAIAYPRQVGAEYGQREAMAAAVVLVLSVAAYVVPSVLGHYGWLPQTLGTALSVLVLWAGRRHIPVLAERRQP